jgi:putative ABC transport system permease protein
MNLMESFKVATGALMTNKLRSVLTMLGVIIGVAAVIGLVSLAQGATAQIEAQLTALGSNLIMLNVQGFARLVPQDIPPLMERVGTLAYGSPVVGQPVTAKARNTTYDTRFEGVSHEYLQIRNYGMLRGRFIEEQDVASRRKVAVIGYTVYRQLFNEQGAVGETINLKGQTFNVIGICAAKGSSMGQDYDDRIFIPYTSAQRLAGTRYVNNVVFKARSAEVASAAAGHLTRILEEKFRSASRLFQQRTGRTMTPFNVFSQDELLQSVSEISTIQTALLAGIAGVSLLVGGIGIMNIMLVSVTERTREIGIRKAVGAKRRDVLAQFLVEAVMLSGMGGLIGIALGAWLGKFIGRFGNISVSVSPLAVAVAFSFACAVGVFFGIYPAVKASNLDPIVALRYE